MIRAGDNPVSQQELCKTLNVSDSTLSRAKQQLVALGWVLEQQVAQGRALRISPKKTEEVRSFITRWVLLGRVAWVRPHSLELTLLVEPSLENARALADQLCSEYWVQRPRIRNSGKYIVYLPNARIVFHDTGRVIQLFLDGIVIPVVAEDVGNFESYLTHIISQRTSELLDLLLPALEESKIVFKRCVVMKDLHLGLLTPKSVPYVLSLAHQLRGAGVYVDDSIAHCNETEVEGPLEKVATIMTTLLDGYFKDLAEKRGVEPLAFKSGTEV